MLEGRLRLAVLLVIGIGIGCGDEAATTACVPGQSIACHGLDGCPGFQTCRNDGAAYDGCVCGSGGSAGDGGTSGTGGDAGTGGGAGSGDDAGTSGSAGAGGEGGTVAQTWVRTVAATSDSPQVGAMAAMAGGPLVALVSKDYGEDFYGFAALRESGDLAWQKGLVGANARAVFPGPDGQYALVAGEISQGVWVAGVDAEGNIGLQEVLTTTADDVPRLEAGTTTADGGMVLVGAYKPKFGTPVQVDGMVLKLDSSWNLQWALAIAHEYLDMLWVMDASALSTGEAVVASVGASDLGGTAWGVTMLDAAGAVVWSRSLRPDEGGQLSYQRVRAAEDGSIYFAGTNELEYNRCEAIVVKLNPQGVIAWQKRASVTSSSTDDQCVKVAGMELVGGEAPIVLLSTRSFGTTPAETGLVQLDDAGAIVSQRRYRNGPPGLGTGLAPWSEAAWAISFGPSGVLSNDSLARVDLAGALGGSCPTELGAPADYAISDVLVNISSGPTIVASPPIDVTVTDTDFVPDDGLSPAVQCDGP